MNLQCPKCLSSSIRRHSYTGSGRQRFSCRDCGHRTVNPLGIEQLDETIPYSVTAGNKAKARQSKRFFVTSAQNATPVPEHLFRAVLAYCEAMDAQLIVIPYRYRNPNSVFADKDYEWWDEQVVPYLCDQRFELCDNLMLLGDIKIQPTAVNPLTGLEGFSGTSSCIVGHPRAEMRTVATRAGDMAKIMQTTGSLTVKNYTSSKAGKKGDFHHIFGGLVIEKDRDLFHMRRVSVCKDGTFYDLDKRWGPEGLIQEGVRAEGLVLGDLHCWWLDKGVREGVFGKGGMLDRVKPKNLMCHDVCDSYAINHHHRNSPFIKYAKHQHQKHNIYDEIRYAADFLRQFTDRTTVNIVPSNHDDHIKRWLDEADWKQDPENAEFYLETALYLIRETQMGEGGAKHPNPFKWWVNRIAPELNVLDYDHSFVVGGYECGLHGHKGPNGARGSLQNLSNIGPKVIHGHVHSPGEKNGSLAAGTNTTLHMEYAGGPSGWLHTQVIIYPDGKASPIHVINGRYCA